MTQKTQPKTRNELMFIVDKTYLQCGKNADLNFLNYKYGIALYGH